MKNRSRTYLRWLAAGCLFGFAAVAALNLAVDPQLIWGSPWGISFLKYRSGNWSRALKTELLRRSRAEMLLIGTSVANWGFDPDSPPLRGLDAFNSGWVSGQVMEIRSGLELALSIHTPKHIIYCLDFRSFSDSQPIAQFAESRLNPKLDKTNYFLSGLLGYGATSESVRLLRERIAGRVSNICWPSGFNATPQAKDPGERLESWCRLWLRVGPKAPSEHAADAQYRDFERILDLCAERRIKLTMCFTPHHAAHTELIEAGGLAPAHEAWKRNVANLIWKHNRALPPGAEPFRIWNFGGCDGPTAEAWTGKASGEGADKWYIDPGHCHATLGALVLSQLLGVPSSEGPAGWVPGFELTEANTEQDLRREREARERYARSGCEDVEVIRRIALEFGFAGVE